jgi:uncharacterized protein (TIGR00369 family)
MSIDYPDTILKTLDIHLVEYTPEKVVFEMPVTPRVHQPYGMLHGGVSVVLAETVASAGSAQFVDVTRQMVVGLEINANHIRSIKDGMIKGTGIPVHIGRSTVVWEIRITDEQERLVCISRCTIAIRDLPLGTKLAFDDSVKLEAHPVSGQ